MRMSQLPKIPIGISFSCFASSSKISLPLLKSATITSILIVGFSSIISFFVFSNFSRVRLISTRFIPFAANSFA